jgi:hypothetical protein
MVVLLFAEEKQLFEKSFEEENEATNVTEVSKFEAIQDLEAEAMQVCVCVCVCAVVKIVFYSVTLELFARRWTRPRTST